MSHWFIASAVTGLCMAGSAFGQCDVTVPAGAIEQNDPNYCGTTGEIDTNGGCNDDPATWQDLGSLAEGDTVIYGNVGAWTNGDAVDTRDLDWYRFTAPTNGVVTFTFNAANAGVDVADFVGFIGTNTEDCTTYELAGYLFPCGGFIEQTVAAGGS